MKEDIKRKPIKKSIPPSPAKKYVTSSGGLAEAAEDGDGGEDGGWPASPPWLQHPRRHRDQEAFGLAEGLHLVF